LETSAVARSTSAIALFSCSETHAVVESAETVTYSGSMSCATVSTPGLILTPAATSSERWLSKLSKVAVATLADSNPDARSMTLIVPSGSLAVT
jgi:hypothetical protein